MELRTLRYFVVVAQELNITRAAERLNMSQPPLSNQIKALEEELGAQLLIRGKRYLQLTEAGTLLYRRAVQMLDIAEKTRQEISDLQSEMSGLLSIGCVEGRAPFYLSRWIAGFKEEYPRVQYSLWNGSSDDILDRLREGLLDIAVIAAPYDSEHLHSFAVGREPWVAMFSKEHPLARLEGDTLPLTSRERRRASIQIVRQPYLFRYLPNTFLPLLFWYFIIFQSKFNISVNGHRRINGIVLKYHCHIPLSGCHICHILSINQNLSITLRPDTCNHTE